MISILAILALAIGTCWVETPGLFRRKRTRELIVFFVLLFAGTVLFAAFSLHVKLPNPYGFMKYVFGPLHNITGA